MAGEYVDELLVAVTYDYRPNPSIAADFKGLIALAGSIAAALAGITYAAASNADALHDQAAAVDLSTEAWTELLYIADRSGASTEALRMGLVTLNRQLQMARSGSKDAADAFAALKVDPRQFNDGAEALDAVRHGLAGLKEADQARVRLLLFGEAQGKLKELLGRTDEEFDQLATRAHQLGVVVGDEAADAAGELMDNLGDLQLVVRGVTNNIGLALTPHVAELVGGLRDWYVANSEIIDQQIDRVVWAIGEALDGLQTPAGKAVAAAGALATAWGGLGAAKAFHGAVVAASPVAAALSAQAAAAAASVAAAGPLALALVAVGLALDDVYVAAEDGDSVLLALAETMGARGEASEAAKAFTVFLGDLGDLAVVTGGALQGAFADGIQWIADNTPYAAAAVERLAEAFRNLDVPAFFEGAEDVFKQSSKATRFIGRAVSGEATAADRAGWKRFQEESSLGQVVGMSANIQRMQTQAWNALPPIIPSVTVNSGPSADEIARTAGDEVARQVREALGVP